MRSLSQILSELPFGRQNNRILRLSFPNNDGPHSLLLANRLESQRYGCLAVIGSVAGSRGRRTNYVYGAAKGGVEIFLQGLRGRLLQSNVTVLTIKPGLVDTPMTAGLRKNALYADAPHRR